MRVLLAIVFTLLTAAPALAVQPDEMLDNPKLEARAREISKELRCVVCQNESIDESNAELARDLRLLVRDRLTKGDSNEEVIQYVVDRYGDFVLLKPPFKVETYALWFGPGIIAVLGIIGLIAFYRRRSIGAAAPPPLSDEERRRLDAVLRDGDTE
jgi:cytochrome c-type biogenesis protein CcmH